jgi:hypothetical protein
VLGLHNLINTYIRTAISNDLINTEFLTLFNTLHHYRVKTISETVRKNNQPFKKFDQGATSLLEEILFNKKLKMQFLYLT